MTKAVTKAKNPKAGPSRIAALAAAQAARDAAAADDDDAGIFLPDDDAPAAPDPLDPYSVWAALADAALAAALPARLRSRLAAGKPVALVIGVQN